MTTEYRIKNNDMMQHILPMGKSCMYLSSKKALSFMSCRAQKLHQAAIPRQMLRSAVKDDLIRERVFVFKGIKRLLRLNRIETVLCSECFTVSKVDKYIEI